MGMYDQLLSLTQQGLDRNNQIAMTSAQQPTMADVFMERFRQGGKDRLDAQKTQSDMAMMAAYKNAQIQQMEHNAANQDRQKIMDFGKYSSENYVGTNRQAMTVIGEAMGLNKQQLEQFLPQMQYQDTKIGGQSMGAPDMGNVRGSMPEEYTPEKTIQTPIPFSNWGTKAKFTQNGLDLKETLGRLSNSAKLKMIELRAMKPGSAIGKLNEDYAKYKGTPMEISDEDYAQMKFHLENVINPQSAAAILNGGQVLAPFVGPHPYGAPGTPGQRQQQPQTPQPQRVDWSGGPGGTPDKTPPATPDGPQPILRGEFITEKAAQEAATIKAEEDGKALQMNVTDRLIDRLISNPALKKGVFIAGKVRRDAVTDPDVKTLEEDLETLRNAETLQMIGNMKTRGGLVVRNLAEFKALGNSLRNLESGSPKLEANLRTIKKHLNDLREVMASSAAAAQETKRPGSTRQSAPGSLDALDKFLSEQGH